MNVHHPVLRRRRARGGQVLVILAMGVLAAAFFRVQVLDGSRWALRAEANHIRQLPVPAPRGVIYDRNGRALADNVPGYSITLLPGPEDSVRATLARLGSYLDLPPDRVAHVMDEVRRYGREVVLDDDASFRTVSALAERAAAFADVAIEMRPRRHYPGGPATAHVLGRVGSITADELGSREFPEGRYGPGSIVGQTGVEREYESRLQGTDGVRYVEVDARGRVVGDFVTDASVPPKPGHDLHLNLDLDLQEFIDHVFPDSLAGAVVALDPSDGGVLALYSHPTYDPNAFVGGIPAALWDSLSSDTGRPLYDRATQGLYPPASTWKPVSAAIALQLGVVDPTAYMPEPCTGSFVYAGRVWHCWKAHGYNDLAEAIGNSCDVYFYQLGLSVGLDRFLSGARALGFGGLTGVDLPHESAGTFPADREFWHRRFGYEPQESEVLSLAIGQGPNTQTPIRMAQFYEALARNDGTAPPPAVAQGVNLGPGWRLHLSPANREAILDGLRRVTAPGGTAHMDATLRYWQVLGKTGTGQTPASLSGQAKNDAWFAGMAGPFGEPPEIVVVAVVERGGEGSAAAAPLVAKTADFYLRETHGIPLDTIQTLREWVRARGWPAWYRARYEPASPSTLSEAH